MCLQPFYENEKELLAGINMSINPYKFLDSKFWCWMHCIRMIEVKWKWQQSFCSRKISSFLHSYWLILVKYIISTLFTSEIENINSINWLRFSFFSNLITANGLASNEYILEAQPHNQLQFRFGVTHTIYSLIDCLFVVNRKRVKKMESWMLKMEWKSNKTNNLHMKQT